MHLRHPRGPLLLPGHAHRHGHRTGRRGLRGACGRRGPCTPGLWRSPPCRRSWPGRAPTWGPAGETAWRVWIGASCSDPPSKRTGCRAPSRTDGGLPHGRGGTGMHRTIAAGRRHGLRHRPARRRRPPSNPQRGGRSRLGRHGRLGHRDEPLEGRRPAGHPQRGPSEAAAARTAHPRQLRKSWYLFYFGLPRLPERQMRAGHWRFFRNFLRAARPEAQIPEDISPCCRWGCSWRRWRPCVDVGRCSRLHVVGPAERQRTATKALMTAWQCGGPGVRVAPAPPVLRAFPPRPAGVVSSAGAMTAGA
jgi:hypothetical protein